MKTAVIPGSFDPITYGHVDVIERSLNIFDKVVVLVGENPSKTEMFSKDERIQLIRDALKAYDGRLRVEHFSGLLLDYMKKNGYTVIVRGLRAISDFEYEFQRALFNRELDEEIDTIFIMTKDDYSFIKSSIIKEIAMFGGDITKFVPENVAKKLKERFSKTQ